MDWLDLLAVQETLKSLLQNKKSLLQHNPKTSILRRSAFFIVQLSHPHMITEKTIALTRQSSKLVLVIANTLFQQHKRRLYTWTSPDGQYQIQIDYILCSQRWRSSIQSAKTRPGADCGLDHELLIAKFRLKLKKVEKITRPFRYDLNQIPYDYSGREK